MKRLINSLLVFVGIFAVAQAILLNAASACAGGAYQDETPNCMK
jgi:cyclic lactone autoinducer peptide